MFYNNVNLKHKLHICHFENNCIQHKEHIRKHFHINPFHPEFFFFSSFSGTQPKIGSFRLPTHSCDAQKKIFEDTFLN